MRLLLRNPVLLAAALALLPAAGRAMPASPAAPTPTDVVGVLANGDPAALKQLGATWYLTSDATPGVVAGMNRASIVRLTPPPDVNAVLAAVASRPGSAWVIGNEPNVPTVETSDNLSPDAYAELLHSWEAAIHQVDPGAIIVGPNVLNWTDTCVGCAGYTSGADWTQAFYDAYVAAYSTRPPFDRWAIHSYELNWEAPPTLRTDHHKRQLRDFRAWLDGIADEIGRPIWNTEMGFHWAYPGWTFDANQKLVPVGEYDTVGVQAWLREMLTWLSTEGVQLNVERTFLYAQTGALEGSLAVYGGLALLSTGRADATPTPAGLVLAAFYRGQ